MIAAIGSALPAAGCGRSGSPLPPQIRVNSDTCAGCGMALSDARTAGAHSVGSQGSREFLLYDDLGCMLDAERDASPPKVIERFVIDYERGGWITAETAWYVCDRSLRTPMDSGIVAFGDRITAEAAARRAGGVPRTWREIQDERKRWMEEHFGKPPG